MRAFIDPEGGYYEGDQTPGATEVPERPGPTYEWNGGAWVPDAAKAKAESWALIKAERDRRTTSGGFKVVIGGADKWFHSDSLSRTQHMGMKIMGSALPAGIMWKTMDGSFVEMSPAIATAIFSAAAASDQAIFAAAETHRAAMEASPAPASYDFSGGWPKVYGE